MDFYPKHSDHDCTKCCRPIAKGQEVEAFGSLYHERCAPKNVRGTRRLRTTVGELKKLVRESASNRVYGWIVKIVVDGQDAWIGDDGEPVYDPTQAAVYAREHGPGSATYEAETGEYDDAVVEPARPGYVPTRE